MDPAGLHMLHVFHTYIIYIYIYYIFTFTQKLTGPNVGTHTFTRFFRQINAGGWGPRLLSPTISPKPSRGNNWELGRSRSLQKIPETMVNMSSLCCENWEIPGLDCGFLEPIDFNCNKMSCYRLRGFTLQWKAPQNNPDFDKSKIRNCYCNPMVCCNMSYQRANVGVSPTYRSVML